MAHIGALDVLDREGIEVGFIAGSSIGGLIGALYAAGFGAPGILEISRTFRFPSWYVPGAVVTWDRIFPGAAGALKQARFEGLRRRLAVVATDLESGQPVVLHSGPVLPAIRATCALPGVLPPVQIEGQWLVDGCIVNLLPVDLAAMADPDVVVAVSVHCTSRCRVPVSRVLAGAGRFSACRIPNPITARAALEVLVRSTEIALDRQYTLAAAMIGPEVLVQVDIGTIGLRDFHRAEEAVTAGRHAMEAAMPALRTKIEASRAAQSGVRAQPESPVFCPVCTMMVSPRRAAAIIERDGATYCFCSLACRDCFLRSREEWEEKIPQ